MLMGYISEYSKGRSSFSAIDGRLECLFEDFINTKGQIKLERTEYFAVLKIEDLNYLLKVFQGNAGFEL